MISIVKEEIGNVKEKIERTHFFHINMNTIVNAILKDNEVVGFVDYYIDTTRSEIYLDVIEILDEFQNKGYGREVVNLLFKKYPDINKIVGLSHPNAVSFWNNLGAEFFDTCKYCNYNGCTNHPRFDESSWSKDSISEGICDDYSEYNFELHRDMFLSKAKMKK